MQGTSNPARSNSAHAAAEPYPAPGYRWRERRRDPAGRDALARRVLSEFREMPCLRLTAEQAQRLFGLPPDVSRRVIGKLMEEGHVRLDPDGRYVATRP